MIFRKFPNEKKDKFYKNFFYSNNTVCMRLHYSVPGKICFIRKKRYTFMGKQRFAKFVSLFFLHSSSF